MHIRFRWVQEHYLDEIKCARIRADRDRRAPALRDAINLIARRRLCASSHSTTSQAFAAAGRHRRYRRLARLNSGPPLRGPRSRSMDCCVRACARASHMRPPRHRTARARRASPVSQGLLRFLLPIQSPKIAVRTDWLRLEYELACRSIRKGFAERRQDPANGT